MELEAEYVAWRKAVGFGIAICRKEKKLTQQELGERIGRSRSWVARAEIGQRAVEYGELIMIARKIGISLQVLEHRIQTWNGDSAAE